MDHSAAAYITPHRRWRGPERDLPALVPACDRSALPTPRETAGTSGSRRHGVREHSLNDAAGTSASWIEGVPTDRRLHLPPVRLPPMSDPNDIHDEGVVVDAIDDAVVPDAQSAQPFRPLQENRSTWSGIGFERREATNDLLLNRCREARQLASG